MQDKRQQALNALRKYGHWDSEETIVDAMLAHRAEAEAAATEHAARIADRYAKESHDWRDQRSFNSLAAVIRSNRYEG